MQDLDDRIVEPTFRVRFGPGEAHAAAIAIANAGLSVLESVSGSELVISAPSGADCIRSLVAAGVVPESVEPIGQSIEARLSTFGIGVQT